MRISDGSSDVCSSDLRDAALATYEKAIQTAFQEVSDALARRGTIADQERAQEQLVASATDNYQLSDARYRGGVDSFLRSLDAQRSLYNARRSLIATELTKATNLVTLYRSEEHTSELQSLMRTSYAVFCLKKHNISHICNYISPT